MGGEDLVYGTLVYLFIGTISTVGGIFYFSKRSGGTRADRIENAK